MPWDGWWVHGCGLVGCGFRKGDGRARARRLRRNCRAAGSSRRNCTASRGLPMNGRSVQASCAPRKRLPASQLQQNPPRRRPAAAHFFEQPEEALICEHARESDHGNMREQHDAVPGDIRGGAERRRIPEHEQRERTERAEHDRGRREAHENGERGLAKREPGARAPARACRSGSALPAQVRKIKSGNFTAVKAAWSGARQRPTVAP